ncbi:hypothetical protein BS78_09G225700, partial [Paspalum vaginatum]
MGSASPLKTITLGHQNCKVIGRLFRLWDAINMKSKFPDPLISIDGVLLDEDVKGYVYMFTDVAAIDIKNKSHIYHHQSYMLQFKHSTKVHQLETRGSDIPKFSFNFCPFDKLPEKATFAKPLQGNTFIAFLLLMITVCEQTQEIRLWGKHGETFDEEAVLKKSQEGIVVAIFAGLAAGSFLGTTQVSSTSTTKVYIDLDIPEVKTYQTSYQWESPPLQQQLPQVIRLSPVQAAGKLYTLEQISN